MTSAPVLPMRDFASARDIAPNVAALFNLRTEGDRWVYETGCMDGSTCKRSKSFFSVAPPNTPGWKKYDWLGYPGWKQGDPYKHPAALYFWPPARPLKDSIADSGGLLYMTGGDVATMSLLTAGVWHTTNTFGDTAIPPTFAADMKALGVRKLVLLPDRDNSGLKWAVRIRDLLIEAGPDFELEVRALPYPMKESHGADTNDWWIKLVDEALTGDDPKATLREHLTLLKDWHLPEPERKTDANLEAFLSPLELPADFLQAVERALGVEPRLTALGWARKPVRCPFHDDAHPSAYWNRFMGILRCHSACGKSYLAKETGERLGLRLADFLSATPRIPVATTAGGTTVSVLPKTEHVEPDSEPEPAASPALQLRPPLPKEAALDDAAMNLAASGRAWLGDYVRWASKAAPASPPIFHEAMGLWLLASASTRRLRLSVGGEDIYPNLYVLIVAKTSLYRKTTAMKQVRRMLEAAGLAALRLPEDATPEALFDELCGVKPSNFEAMPDAQRNDWLKGRAVAAQRTIMKDEASSIFANMRKDYMQGLAELLLQGYDPDSGRTQKLLKGRGLITLNDLCLSFLGATTPVMMAKYMTNEEVENGFVARFAIVTPEGPPVYSDSSEPVGVPQYLIDRLRAVFLDVLPWHGGRRPGGAQYTTEVVTPPAMQAQAEPLAMRRLLAYRKALGFTMLANDTVGEDKHASYSRLPTMAIKAALLLAMSETKPGDTVRVTEAHACAAIVIAERWRESLHRLDRDTARATHNRTEDKVLEYLRTAGQVGVPFRDIKRDCAIRDKRTLEDALTTLADAGLVESYKRLPPGPGRPAVCYRVAVGHTEGESSHG